MTQYQLLDPYDIKHDAEDDGPEKKDRGKAQCETGRKWGPC
jgi:hypothetical protein